MECTITGMSKLTSHPTHHFVQNLVLYVRDVDGEVSYPPPPPGLHRGIPRQFRPSQSVMTSHYMPSHSDSAGAMSEEYIGPGCEIPGPGFDTHCFHWSEDT